MTSRTDAADVVRARKVLHVVAEKVLAGPMHRRSGEITLFVTETGFLAKHDPGPGIDILELRFRGTVAELGAHPSGDVVPVQGTVRELAGTLGLVAGAPEGLYHEHAELGIDDDLAAHADAVAVVLQSLTMGAKALSELAHAELSPQDRPILWPEHFDVGISLDEVNYGVSPGDAGHDRPYAYVGPWTPRSGDFWNEPFGASQPVAELQDAAGVLGFFREGRRLSD